MTFVRLRPTLGPVNACPPISPFAFDGRQYPQTPGVYLMKGASGKILYVGKAKSLRARLSSYFRSGTQHAPKTLAMLSHVHKVDILLTSTEKEALLLEASLINKHRPRYNIVLRDDKSYILFRLDKRAEYPRLSFTRKVVRDGSVYFGPFTSSRAARSTWKELGKLFAIRKCSDKSFDYRKRPCLYFHMNQCLGPCSGGVPRERYMELVRQVEAFLSGKSSEVLRELRARMNAEAEALRFEEAARLRDVIAAMELTVEGQAVVKAGDGDLDAVILAHHEDAVAACVLFVRQGRLIDKASFVWPARTDGETALGLESFLAQFYKPQDFVPPRVILDPDQAKELARRDQGAMELLAEILAERREAPVTVAAARGREERGLMDLARANALRAIDEERMKRESGLGRDLAGKLRLAAEPARIETVDVSHLGGKDVRVAQVVWEDGRLKKSDYRVYKIEEAEGTGDDYLALASWAARRGAKGAPWPDMVLVDGGKGQIEAVRRGWLASGADFEPAIRGIVKGSHAANVMDEEIYMPGRKNPLNLAPGSRELLFLQDLRDTAHRLAITRQRKAKRKSALKSELLDIPGVGPKTAAALWERFDSVADMAAAGEEGLARVPGVGPALARVIASKLAEAS